VSVETVKTIDGIRFSIWSPTEIRKYSVVEITAPETYDEDGMPVQGGLMDGRLGTLEPGQKCLTCGNTAVRCPGHFGHIELAEPVLHIAFIDNIHKLLLSMCRSCARLKVPQDELDAFKAVKSKEAAYTIVSQKRIPEKIIEKARKARECPHCGKAQYELIFTKPSIFVEKTEVGEHRLLPITIRERFSQILDEDLSLLSYDPTTARPEWFVLQALPVPPVTVRPSIILETGIRSEDDLTHKMVDIIRVNQRLKESKEAGTPPLIVQDLVDLLQYHTTTYFDNEVSGIPQAHHRSGRPLKTLTQRLKGKEGRFRGSLSGKRVDFSSRTVISPDPNLDLSEVGVPESVAMKLTIPEIVTEWNIDRMRQLIINGPAQFPGVNYIVRPDGVKIRLDFVDDRSGIAESLERGYMVERHLSDGDIVMFNRQPSLHQMSIMAHYVRVLPGKTFRLHPSVCPPYNADFDGDEMNLHVPQSEEARAEAILLMRVQEIAIGCVDRIRVYRTAGLGVYQSRDLRSNNFHKASRALDVHLIGTVPAVVDLGLHAQAAGKGVTGHAPDGKPVLGGRGDVERCIRLIGGSRDLGIVENTEAAPDPHVRPVRSHGTRAEGHEHQRERGQRAFRRLRETPHAVRQRRFVGNDNP